MDDKWWNKEVDSQIDIIASSLKMSKESSAWPQAPGPPCLYCFYKDKKPREKEMPRDTKAMYTWRNVTLLKGGTRHKGGSNRGGESQHSWAGDLGWFCRKRKNTE